MSSPHQRIEARARFLFRGESKFFLQGVTYGPFRPSSDAGVYFLDETKTKRDFDLIRKGGFNALRVYHSPPKWFMDLAAEYALPVMITVPWEKRVLFLDDHQVKRATRENIARCAKEHAGHAAFMGIYVDNEIPADLVRWYGARRVEDFLDSLAMEVKESDPAALVSYANFPPTEFLLPRLIDFYSYNVYLHEKKDLRAYLHRLQNLAEDKPLVLGEFGMDTIRHTEEEQRKLLCDFHETWARAGLAGSFLFAWTDEWFTNGVDVEDWAFGLVKKDRTPKKSYFALKEVNFPEDGKPHLTYPIPDAPKVSIVVCSYNGASTLRDCLSSLQNLHYPDYEVILVDDGSKDNTQEIVKDFPSVVNICQKNQGLSVARNVGIEASRGEIVAFTDSDCMADKDWLYYLVQTLLNGDFAAVGGPNISPPARDWIQAAVAVSPGAPSHVLLSDDEAEHVPGCNMAYHKWALEMIGGFDPVYRKAGDDVDVCWRLMQCGHKIGFSPSALVWHYRRFTVKTYFSQQRGYGEAESLLKFKHSAYFDSNGSAKWKGVIYGQNRTILSWEKPVIYHGVFGTGFFQSIYPGKHPFWTSLVTSLEWNFATAGIFLVSIHIHEVRAIPLLLFGCTLAAGISYMFRVRIEPKHDRVAARFLVFYLAIMQPMVRSWARYFTWIREKKTPPELLLSHEENIPQDISLFTIRPLAFWSENGKERLDLIDQIQHQLKSEGWKYIHDTGWTDWDIQVLINRWWHLRVRTLTEIYPHGKRLTRIAIEPLPASFTYLTLIIFAMFGLACQAFHENAWWVFVPAATCFIAYQSLKGLLVKRRIAELVYRCADDLGMVFVK